MRDYKNQGDILLKVERANEALTVFRKAEQLLTDQEWDQMERMLVWHKIGTAYQMKGDYQTAKSYYENILDAEEKIEGVSAREFSTDYSSLGCLFLDMGMYREAYENIKKAVELDAGREEDAKSIMTCCYPASACAELTSEGYEEYYEEAVECFEEVISFREANYRKQNTDLADAYHEYSLFLIITGNMSERWITEGKLMTSINLFILKLAPVYQGIGECYIEKEDYESAIGFLLRSLDLNDGKAAEATGDESRIEYVMDYSPKG